MKVLKFIVVSVVLATLLINTNVTVFAQEYEWQQLFTRPGLDGDPNNPSEDVWDYVPKEKTRYTATPDLVNPFTYQWTITRNNESITCNDIVMVSETVSYAACNSYIFKLTANAAGNVTETVSFWAGLGAPYNFYSIGKTKNNRLYVAGGLFQGGQYIGILYSKNIDDADEWENVGNYYNNMFTNIITPEDHTLYDNGVIAVGPSYNPDYNNSPEGLFKLASSRASAWRPFLIEGVAGRSYGNHGSVIDNGSWFKYYLGGSRFCTSDTGIGWECTAPANGAESFINGVDISDEYRGAIVGAVGNTGWLRLTTNGGATWGPRQFTASVPFNSVTYSDWVLSTMFIAAGNMTPSGATGGIYVSITDGQSWARSSQPANDTKMVKCSTFHRTGASTGRVNCIGQRLQNGRVVSDIYTATFN